MLLLPCPRSAQGTSPARRLKDSTEVHRALIGTTLPRAEAGSAAPARAVLLVPGAALGSGWLVAGGWGETPLPYSMAGGGLQGCHTRKGTPFLFVAKFEAG